MKKTKRYFEEKRERKLFNEYGMTILEPVRRRLQINESLQEVLADSNIFKLMEIYNTYGDEFICEDGKIKSVVVY